MVDLHLHSTSSDGKMIIQSVVSNELSKFSLISFTDHECIFDPNEYCCSGKTRLIAGSEICCSYLNKNIEILAYDFNPMASDIIHTVSEINKNRRQFIFELLEYYGYPTTHLPTRPFRYNTPLPLNIDRVLFWKKHELEYKAVCHQLRAEDVIHAIIVSGGIPVLAHPMESLSNCDDEFIDFFIKNLGIQTIELLTPKHSVSDILLVDRISKKYGLQCSIGSDSHAEHIGAIPYAYNLADPKFKWLRNFL